MLERYLPNRLARIAVLVALPLTLAWLLFMRASWLPRTLSSDAAIFFSPAADGTLQVTKPLPPLKDGRGSIDALAFSPDGKTLASSRQITIHGVRKGRTWAYGNGQIQLWSVSKGVVLQTLPLIASMAPKASPFLYRQLVFSPDGQFLLGGEQQSSLALLSLSTNRLIYLRSRVYPAKCHLIGFSRDSKTAFYEEEDKPFTFSMLGLDEKVLMKMSIPLRIVHVATSTGKITKRLTFEITGGWPQQFVLLPDGKTAACTVALKNDGMEFDNGQQKIILFDVNTGKIQQEIKANRSSGSKLACSPDGKWLVGGAYNGRANSNFLRLFEIISGKISEFARVEGDYTDSFAFAPDSKTVASLASNGIVETWNVKSHRLERVLGKHINARIIAFAPDGKTVATGGETGDIKLFRTE